MKENIRKSTVKSEGKSTVKSEGLIIFFTCTSVCVFSCKEKDKKLFPIMNAKIELS